jgi:hypothetical protein
MVYRVVEWGEYGSLHFVQSPKSSMDFDLIM